MSTTHSPSESLNGQIRGVGVGTGVAVGYGVAAGWVSGLAVEVVETTTACSSVAVVSEHAIPNRRTEASTNTYFATITYLFSSNP